MIAEIIIFALAILIHELGHYIGYLLFSLNPKVELKWWGIQIGSNVDFELYP